MKKQFLTLIATVLITLSISAQTNYEKRLDDNVKTYIERIESNIEISAEEKEKIYTLKKEHTINFWKVSKEYKGKPELAAERKKVSVVLSEAIVEAFGRKRGVEILKAARQKKS